MLVRYPNTIARAYRSLERLDRTDLSLPCFPTSLLQYLSSVLYKTRNRRDFAGVAWVQGWCIAVGVSAGRKKSGGRANHQNKWWSSAEEAPVDVLLAKRLEMRRC